MEIDRYARQEWKEIKDLPLSEIGGSYMRTRTYMRYLEGLIRKHMEKRDGS